MTHEKQSKSDRISALEKQVAELNVKFEALQSVDMPFLDEEYIVKALLLMMQGSFKKQGHKLSANEKRKEIIAEAKAFVEDLTKRMNNGKNKKEGNNTFRLFTTKPEFHVNAEKRTVVALVKGANLGRLFEKGIAKCATDDVFNADIGTAIALGRALGLDVSKFEQAVKPTEVVVGQVVNATASSTFETEDFAVVRVEDWCVFDDIGKGWISADSAIIKEDTDAQY